MPDPEHSEDAGARDAVVEVLTVDDDAAFLRLAREVIEATPGFDSVGEAATGEDGVALAAVLRPDLVLMDFRMPGIGGLEAARQIARAGDDRTAVVLMSAHPHAVDPGLMPARAIGLVGKERLCSRWLEAVWAHWARGRGGAAPGATAPGQPTGA